MKNPLLLLKVWSIICLCGLPMMAVGSVEVDDLHVAVVSDKFDVARNIIEGGALIEDNSLGHHIVGSLFLYSDERISHDSFISHYDFLKYLLSVGVSLNDEKNGMQVGLSAVTFYCRQEFIGQHVESVNLNSILKRYYSPNVKAQLGFCGMSLVARYQGNGCYSRFNEFFGIVDDVTCAIDARQKRLVAP